MAAGQIPRGEDIRNQVIRIAVIITSHNRKVKTLACLGSLAANADPDRVGITTVLVDDGSTDGTVDAVLESYPQVQVLIGDGSLYWCRGMHRGLSAVLGGGHDYYLWLNDDTSLMPDAIRRLLDCESMLRAQHGMPLIVVGSTSDSQTGGITYGGDLSCSRWRPMQFRRVVPTHMPQRCDSITGNIVLISREVSRILGNLDPVFEHAMGDTDYAFRARQAGIGLWVGPGIFGHCSGNSDAGTYRDESLSLSRRWRQMMGRKGLPWRSWLVLTKRHTGPLWPLYFVWPYVSLLVGRYRRRGR